MENPAFADHILWKEMVFFQIVLLVSALNYWNSEEYPFLVGA